VIKMNKLILGIFVGIMLAGLVGAGLFSFSNAIIDVPEASSPTRYSGEITFTVDGKDSGSCYLNEPNMNIDDDFEKCLSKYYAGKIITDIEDWTGRTYVTSADKEVRSFDENIIDSYEKSLIVVEPKEEELPEEGMGGVEE